MYLNIVFVYGYEDCVVQDFFDGNIENDELFQHLIEWDYGDEELVCGEQFDPPWGSCDKVEKRVVGSDTYYLSYNEGLGYASLTRKLS